MAPNWAGVIAEDPLPWLLEPTEPAVRASTLRYLLGRGDDDPEVCEARSNAMGVDPIAGFLAVQDERGLRVTPGLETDPDLSKISA